MRLINTETLKLKQFTNIQVPSYVVLSHKWGDDEVTFEEFDDAKSTTKAKSGYQKIVKYCEISRKSGYLWAWIDTACIDKRSSADLSEAINSMFEYYKNSDECFSYLSDVESTGVDTFSSSRWFTRGWTLQELIAPREVTFFNRDWEPFGSKTGNLTRVGCFPELAGVISQITSIDIRILKGSTNSGLSTLLRSYSVAERMSWAAGRVTTRLEDRAYSLLGIFGINMPLLNRRSIIFAWGLQPPTWATKNDVGILARSPDDFQHSADIIPYRPRMISSPATVTSKGINLDTLIYHQNDKSFATLECRRKSEKSSILAISVESSGPFYTRCIESRTIPVGDLVGVNAQIIVLAKKAGKRQVQRDYANYNFAFDFNRLDDKYRPRVILPHPMSISQNTYMLTSSDPAQGFIDIIFEPSDPLFPTFEVAAAFRRNSIADGDGQSNLRAASTLRLLSEEDCSADFDARITSSKHLIESVRKDLQLQKLPPVGMSFIHKTLVLVMEQIISHLFDNPIVFIKVETILLPDMISRYEEVKGKLQTFGDGGNKLATLMLQNLSSQESSFGAELSQSLQSVYIE